jgi:hypothetical protein
VDHSHECDTVVIAEMRRTDEQAGRDKRPSRFLKAGYVSAKTRWEVDRDVMLLQLGFGNKANSKMLVRYQQLVRAPSWRTLCAMLWRSTGLSASDHGERR